MDCHCATRHPARYKRQTVIRLSHNKLSCRTTRCCATVAMTGSSCLANLATIAWDVYNSCRDGPDELRSIAAHIFALHTSITLLSSRNLDIFAQDWLLRLTEDCQQALCAINSRSCHANKAHNNASQTLTEITEQLIRITAAFTAVHAVLVKYTIQSMTLSNRLTVLTAAETILNKQTIN